MSQTQNRAYSLVATLAAEVSDGTLRLPSLPEAVVRVRNTLANQDFSVEQLARVIATEPVLVGAILTMANSSTFHRRGRETTDLCVAISRIGAGMVQTAATAFAVRQLRDSAMFKDIENLLAPEWMRAARTAAAAYLIAQQTAAIKPDEALVLGLIHNIGRIYLYSRAPQYPELLACPTELEELLTAWHPAVGKAIVESWHLPEDTAEAVARQEEDSEDECLPIVDILKVAIAVAANDEPVAPEVLEALARRPDTTRLRLTEDQLAAIAAEREPLRQSLGLG